MRITKDQVIEAVMTEPLLPGTWFHTSNRTDDGVCNVCAVGAILRKTGLGNSLVDAMKLTDETYASVDVNIAIKKNNFFAILSTFFESTHGFTWSLEERRDLCLHVIESFFPEIGYVEVDL